MDPGPLFDGFEYKESDDNLILEIDLPGVKKEDITIKIHKDVFSVEAKRKQKMFYRNFYMPKNVDTTKILAEYNDGILSVTMPKQEELKPKLIKIN